MEKDLLSRKSGGIVDYTIHRKLELITEMPATDEFLYSIVLYCTKMTKMSVRKSETRLSGFC